MEGTRGSDSCTLGSSRWSRGVKMENSLLASAVLSTRSAAVVESFMRRARVRAAAASFPGAMVR